MKLEILVGDSEGKPEVAMSQTERLIKEGVSVLTGAYQSSAVFSATQTAERFKTPFVVSCGIADRITERGFNYTFRVEGTSSMLTNSFFSFLKTLGEMSGKPVHNLGVFYEDTLFGQEMSNTQKQMAKEFGYKIVADITYPSQNPDVTSYVSKLISTKPDFVIMTSYLNDAILITRTLYEMNLVPMGFLGTGGFGEPNFIQEAGELSENLFISSMWSHRLKLSGVSEVNSEFKQRHGFDMTGFGAICYSTIFAIKDALERAGSIDKDKIRSAVAETDIKVGEKGNILHHGIKFDEKGQNMLASDLTGQIQGGKFIPIWPAEYSPGKPLWPFPGWKK